MDTTLQRVGGARTTVTREHLRDVLAGKRLLLFKEILEELNFPDKTLVDEICACFTLSGWQSRSHVFPSLKRPAQSLESACKVAKGLNRNICKQVPIQMRLWQASGAMMGLD